jgi:hypothetical protein
VNAFTDDSSRHLRHRSKLLLMIATLANNRREQGTRGLSLGNERAKTGRPDMARFEVTDLEGAALGSNAGTDVFFELGMMYSTGRSVPTDLVTAHKWFNIAAMRGNQDAIRYRREIAAEMSETEVAVAQRAARDWLQAGRSAAEHRAAA